MSDRYLANENFPGAMVKLLRDQGNDVLHAADSLVAAADRLVLQTAVSEDRILLTFDRDFGELIFRFHNAVAPGIVLFPSARSRLRRSCRSCKTFLPLRRLSEAIFHGESGAFSPSAVDKCR